MGISCEIGIYEDLEIQQLELLAEHASRNGHHSLYETLEMCIGMNLMLEHKGYSRYLELRKQFPKVNAELFDGIEIYPLCYTKLKNYIRMVSIFESECFDIRTRNQAAYKAFLLFETPEKFKKFVTQTAKSKWRKPSIASINAIQMPPKNDWPKIDLRAWGSAFLRFDLAAVNPLFTTASPHISPVKQNKTISLRDTWARLFTVYEHIGLSAKQSAQLVEEVVKWNVNSRVVKNILTVTSIKKHKTEIDERVPDFRIDGDIFGIESTTLKKLRSDDMRLFFIGKYTDCCEWIGGQYAGYNATPEHVYLERTSDYYILEDNYTGDILAHSWVWRSNENDIVFDGFELSKNFFMDSEHVRMIMNAIVETLGSDDCSSYKIGNVFLGKCDIGIKEVDLIFKDAFRTHALPLLGQQIGANVHSDEKHLKYIGNPRRLNSNSTSSNTIKKTYSP
jgi:hypothetical protein